NEANGECNRDGTNENYSWNMGVEGPADDLLINAIRERQKRNFLSTLLLSQGVPMICGGDEIDRDQKGNNNAYCQDNELSWFDWSLTERRQSLLRFTTRLIQLRRRHPNLRRRKFYQDRAIRGSALKDILWLRPDGEEMTDEEWNAGWVRCLGMMVNGETLGDVDEAGLPVRDNTFLLLLNCYRDHIDFRLPEAPKDGTWSLLIDTNDPDLETAPVGDGGGPTVRLVRQSLMLLREDFKTSEEL
ncbi:MAG: glycogen debranching protein GlgX, partial [Bryobacteraceae bacterium]